jgi:two-component system, chemotaxis family, CheB/CheR fusion protein
MAKSSGERARRRNKSPSPPGDAFGSGAVDPPAQENTLPISNGAFPIVGVGASAGGLEAFTQLLQPLPGDLGLAFILVQHQDPSRPSMLSELLSRVTPMLVQEVQDGMVVQPNQIYVAPSHADVTMTDRVLKLASRPPAHTLHMPIDVFFRSLAEDQGHHAIGIILSGGGSDGALGLQAIKDHGGLTFVQDEQTAAFTGMPHSAIMHGSVDCVLPPEGLADELIQVARHPYVIEPETDTREPRSPVRNREAWGRVLKVLQGMTGINFTAYKPSTITRRMVRRMALHKIEQPGVYAQYIETHREEAEALYHDLLIKVTHFFREPGSFEALKRDVLPRLLQDRPVHQPLRIWVPGCATGEEAYSIAICVLEVLSERGLQHTIRLFATDLDELALARARTGLYIENIALDVSPERLRRFFVKVGQYYQITQSIREMCIFAKHNLYQDAPFSNLDLISCRNVLIYLEIATQRRVIPLFHYALQPDGVLALGPSETIGTFADLFTLVDQQHKFYTKKLIALPATMDFPSHTWGANVRAPKSRITPEGSPSWPAADVFREADRALLQQYAPAAVLVNEQMDILYFRGDTDRYLRPAAGRATLNLFRMTREGLLNELRGAIRQAQQTGSQVRRESTRFRVEETWHEVTIRVIPLTPPSPLAHYLIAFEEPAAPTLPAHQPGSRRRRASLQPAERDQLSRLQQELDATKQYLQAVMEQHEAATEELKAANEEIISSNEELQSTNEELETAKEELQSMNEELLTTNDELRHRNQALSQANNDLHNLFGSVNLPIIMVGNDLCIRRYTAVAEQVLHVIPTDVGRPIGHLQLNITVPDLEGMILQVIETVGTQELEVQDSEGHWYSLRIRPYRTPERQIDGAVLLFIDIDSLKNVDRLTQLLAEVQAARDYAERIVQTVPMPLVILDGQLQVRTANQAFYETFRVTPAETEQRLLYSLGNHQWDIPHLRVILEQIIPQHTEVRDFDMEHTSETIGARTMRLNARRLMWEDPAEAFILLAIQDITEQQRAHDQMRAALQEKELLLRELHHRVKNNLQLVSSLLRLQSDTLQDPAVRQAFEDSQRRLQAIALVHEQLSASPTLAPIHMRTYIQRLATTLFEAYASGGLINLHLDIEEVPVTIDTAMPCALILTELLSNALQHAFPAGQRGEVSITWHAEGEDHLLLMIQDTGIGMPPEVDPAHTDSLGLTLVQSLVEQLGGSIQVDRSGGTTIAIRFPSARA